MVDENTIDKTGDTVLDQGPVDLPESGQPVSDNEAASLAGVEGEYVDVLQIRMGGKDFLLSAADVSEIVRPILLTPVPMAPDHLMGVGNIHGQIVCVIDPGEILDLPEPPATEGEDTRFVCLRHARMRVAIRVDAVPAIHRLRKDALPHASAAGATHVLGRMTVEGVDYDVLSAVALLHE
ncbi:MAG: hypothetical protein BMS9Abin18_1044 [Zetaproteobacteria bacterium]|nr:MAG: hypothetical protein BMS9Abin18_1044 [Zetaproteobacteria bacterium]